MRKPDILSNQQLVCGALPPLWAAAGRTSVVRGRSFGVDAERVDVGLHQVADGVVDESVTLQWAEPAKTVRGNADVKVAAAIASAGVPNVLVALIGDLEPRRSQGRFDALPDPGNTVFAHGSTCLNGLTVTLT